MEIDSHRQRHGELHQRADEHDLEDGTSSADSGDEGVGCELFSAEKKEPESVLVRKITRDRRGDAIGDYAQVETELREARLESDVVVGGIDVPHRPAIGCGGVLQKW